MAPRSARYAPPPERTIADCFVRLTLGPELNGPPHKFSESARSASNNGTTLRSPALTGPAKSAATSPVALPRLGARCSAFHRAANINRSLEEDYRLRRVR